MSGKVKATDNLPKAQMSRGLKTPALVSPSRDSANLSQCPPGD